MNNILVSYNSKLHSINQIWKDIRWETPFIVRKPGHAAGFAVLVSQFREDVACGYPIMHGKKVKNSWYNHICVGPQIIPSSEEVEWELVDIPNTNVQEIMASWASSDAEGSQMKLGFTPGSIDDKKERDRRDDQNVRKINEILFPSNPKETYESLDPIDKNIYSLIREKERKNAVSSKSPASEILKFFGEKKLVYGKYAGYSIKELWTINPGYVKWAIDNVRQLRN